MHGDGRQDGLADGEAAIDPGAVEQIDLADEVGDEARPRPLVDLTGRADLLDAAGIHDGDPVRHGERLLLVVRHEDQGHAEILLDLLQLELHLLPQLAIERAERLVTEQDGRLDHQRPGQRHALLLPAGELRRAAGFVAGQFDAGQRGGDPLGDLRLREAAHPQAEGDVLGDGAVREQGIGLEDHAHVPLVYRHVGDVTTADEDAALIDRLETGDHPQGRRLAAAGRAEQREEFARTDVERHVIDRSDDPVIGLRHRIEADRGGSPFRREVHRQFSRPPFNHAGCAGRGDRSRPCGRCTTAREAGSASPPSHRC